MLKGIEPTIFSTSYFSMYYLMHNLHSTQVYFLYRIYNFIL